MKKFIVLLSALFVLAGCGVTSHVTVDPQVVKALKNRRYEMICDYMYPTGYPMQRLGGGYFVEIRDEHITFVLPYIGSHTDLTFAGWEGIDFDEDIDDYSSKRYKDHVDISFKVTNISDTYSCTLKVYYDGSATLDVIPAFRHFISYGGMVRPL